jgi:hypothetical protein
MKKVILSISAMLFGTTMILAQGAQYRLMQQTTVLLQKQVTTTLLT